MGLGEGVVQGRVVYLAPPDDPLSPVVAGTAVITTGEFLGQRVEFDRNVCLAYAFPLAKADLSHIIATGGPFCSAPFWEGLTFLILCLFSAVTLLPVRI